MTTTAQARARFNRAGILLGIGVGGFFDGIVLHQILQWHHMLSSEGSYPPTTIAGLEANTLADGLFHAFAWVCTLAGVVLMTRAMREGYRGSGAQQLGLVLAGFGTFNLVEGTIDHHVLQVHHVRAGEGQAALDVAFLLLGAALLAGGLLLARREERRLRPATARV